MATIQRKQNNGTFQDQPPDVLSSSPVDTFRINDITGTGFTGPIEVSRVTLRVRVTLEGTWPEGVEVEMHSVVDTAIGSSNPPLYAMFWQGDERLDVFDYPTGGAAYIGVTITGLPAGSPPVSLLLEMFE